VNEVMDEAISGRMEDILRLDAATGFDPAYSTAER
jgi:hypothetical protein